jgi:hypothetical protein
LNSNAYKSTKSFRIAKKIHDDAHRKNKGYKFTLSGHSHGGLPTNILLNTKKDLDDISLNPAYKGKSQYHHEDIIRSSLDLVSILKEPKNAINNVLFPEWSENHNITIPAKILAP